jgi:hypothetical protein
VCLAAQYVETQARVRGWTVHRSTRVASRSSGGKARTNLEVVLVFGHMLASEADVDRDDATVVQEEGLTLAASRLDRGVHRSEWKKRLTDKEDGVKKRNEGERQ